MDQLLYYIAIGIIAFVVLAWESDIKPRIFSNPDAVKLKPEIKLGILIYSAFLYAALILYLILLSIGPDIPYYPSILGIIVVSIALYLGNYFTKRSIRRTFYDFSISLCMNPEEYAKTICPHYVVQYIETHLTDKKALAKYIKHQKRLGNISDPCAWAFLVAYCDKHP